jgi:hypothetical protein
VEGGRISQASNTFLASSPIPTGDNEHEMGLIIIISGGGEFTNVRFENISLETGSVVELRSGGGYLKMSGCKFKNCISSGSNGGGCLNSKSSILISNCIFEDCRASLGGAIWADLGTATGNNFTLENSEFINCFANTGSAHAVYLNVASNLNEKFKFDTITLTYWTSTTEAVLFLNMYNLEGSVGETTSKLADFAKKFIGFCPDPPLNTTDFMVHDVSGDILHPLRRIICIDGVKFFFIHIHYHVILLQININYFSFVCMIIIYVLILVIFFFF